MSISGLCLTKALYTQGIRVPISSTESTATRMVIGPYYSSTCASAAPACGSQKLISMTR
jgi:hypothetical protein